MLARQTGCPVCVCADRVAAVHAIAVSGVDVVIADDDLMNDLSVATKLVPVPSVIADLKAAGRHAAGAFLADHKQDLGRRQTADLVRMFG